MELFAPDAPWEHAAAFVRAFEIPDSLAYSGPEAVLRRIFRELRRRNVELVVGIEPLTGRGPEFCGYHVEGYGSPGGSMAIAQRVKALGGNPRFFAMDGPLYFGHVFNRQAEAIGCHADIAAIAKDVATKVAQIRAIFPDAQIGDVEPLMGFSKESWLSDLETWFDAYAADTGTHLSFLRLDMAWDLPWKERMPALTDLLRHKGIALQVIYNGNDNLKADTDWIASAMANFKDVETGNWPPPDAAVIQSWAGRPSRLLPDTDPLTGTGLIESYVRWRKPRR